MNLKKRLLLLGITVIFIVSFYVNSKESPHPVPSEVEGWGPNVSKEVRDYISETMTPHIMPRNFCLEKGLLLVFVHSKFDKFDARQAVRETWGQKRDNVTFYFLLGEDKNKHHEVQLKLKEESEKYNDIVEERFIDSYNNLTLKSITMLKLFHLHCLDNYKLLMKVDDDVFANMDKILEIFKNRSITTNLLMGQTYNLTKPIRDPTSKWFVPYEVYSDKVYPMYLCGASYVMSSDVAEKLYQCAYSTPIFYIEDIYVTGMCAKKVNVTPQHSSEFYCFHSEKYICLHKHRSIVHYFSPNQIRTSYEILKEKRCPASGSWRESFYSFWYRVMY